MMLRPVQAESLTIAAASDLKFALEEVVAHFLKQHPADQVDVIYGSSGKFQTQIRQGAPYDLFFSADIAYPRALREEGFAASEVHAYAIGRIVLWSPTRRAAEMTLPDLTDTKFEKIALAHPRHAPYGKCAEEALRAAGVWDAVKNKLVFGESVAQAAQFVQSGNAQVGIIAQSLALSPELTRQGGFALIPDTLHPPLTQGFIITRRAATNPLARSFADFMTRREARAVMVRYGFALPGEGR